MYVGMYVCTYVTMRSRDERNKGIRSQRRGSGGFSTRTDNIHT